MRPEVLTRPVAVELSELEGFSWGRCFGNVRPVELEIGVGKGGFLLRRARALPERNLLGIEWANKFYKFAVDRMERWRIPNVRILRTDASHFMRVVCPETSLAALHIYHPDPWPKKRHHKRRLFQKPFVDAAVVRLAVGGRLTAQTDHAEYFETIAALLSGHPRLEIVAFDDPELGVETAGVGTNFEIKYLREGREIFQIAARKKV